MNIEKKDIQGLLIRGHGELSEGAYLLLHIESAAKARGWLGEMLPQITDGESKPPVARLQIAFTHAGLARLGCGSDVLSGFLVEFIHGMDSPYRTRILGDLDESAPEKWRWGGPESPAVHVLLCAYAVDEKALEEQLSELRRGLEGGGLRLLEVLGTESNPYQKEHFGFRDGLSQPFIAGLGKTGPKDNTLPAGEFILGYPNAYQLLPDSPEVPAALDPAGILPASHRSKGMKDFGKNGSYMVFRQLKQDVPSFWKQVRDFASLGEAADLPGECIGLASKMVGRWPNGNPLVLAPEEEGKAIPKPQNNDFGYAKTDELGFKCPLGSHIRRSNPRDAMPGIKPAASIKVSNKHRILRRGRNFGPPLAPSFLPEDLLQAEDDGKERGLHFICFNTNISRQFEFIQHTWCNNTKFAGLYNDPDPILGIKDSRNKAVEHDFSVQASPVRKHVRGLTRHVHVLGGAYFFMPGIKALRFLAHPAPMQQISQQS